MDKRQVMKIANNWIKKWLKWNKTTPKLPKKPPIPLIPNDVTTSSIGIMSDTHWDKTKVQIDAIKVSTATCIDVRYPIPAVLVTNPTITPFRSLSVLSLFGTNWAPNTQDHPPLITAKNVLRKIYADCWFQRPTGPILKPNHPKVINIIPINNIILFDSSWL